MYGTISFVAAPSASCCSLSQHGLLAARVLSEASIDPVKVTQVLYTLLSKIFEHVCSMLPQSDMVCRICSSKLWAKLRSHGWHEG